MRWVQIIVAYNGIEEHIARIGIGATSNGQEGVVCMIVVYPRGYRTPTPHPPYPPIYPSRS